MDRAPGGREVDAPLSLRDSVRHLLACGLSLNGCAGGQEPPVSCVLEDQVCSPGLSITTTQALHGDPWELCKSPPPPSSARSLEDGGGSGGGLCCILCHSPGLGAPPQKPVQVSDAGLLVWGPRDMGPVLMPVVRGLRAESPPVRSAHTHARELSRLLLASGAWAPGGFPLWH